MNAPLGLAAELRKAPRNGTEELKHSTGAAEGWNVLIVDHARFSGLPTYAKSLWRRLLMLGAFGLLIALLLMAPLASRSTASPSRGLAVATARAAENEEEAEGEDESEEAEEEAASAEAEAEEETESESPSSHSHHKPGARSHHHSGSGASAAVISRLTLTAKATTALRHSKPLASAVEFSFMLSAPAKVHVTLVEQTSSHGHKHWTTLPDSLTTNAAKGSASAKLTGHNRLSAGRYRLTLKPSSGRSRSIYLTARP